MTADKKPGRGSDQFPLRLPDGMRERIKAIADQSGRSMNAEIVARLEASFEPGTVADLRAKLARYERIDELTQISKEAAGDAQDETNKVIEMYEQRVTELLRRLAKISAASSLFDRAISGAAAGQEWDLNALLESAPPFPEDDQ